MLPPREPVAIVGSACRFPGGADNPPKLWALLSQPRDVSRRIPAERFAVDGFWHQDSSHHGTSNIAHSYFLDEDPRRFDANFFNINPREAVAMDPQHRLLLETVYESLEFAGLSLESLRGTPTGVYVGLMCADYYDVQARDPESLPQYNATGTARSILSNRVSYFFDWKGPSLTVDTACSSSLVAVHQAVQALRQGECTAAVAAGANLIFGPEMFIAESKLHMLSPTGQSRMWDANADGYARGEGIGVVVLKLLKDAIRDGDTVECVIRETAVNSDGRTNGITMPSAESQADLIRQTYLKAGLDPSKESERCQYFEAHGTGTPAGDPIEAEAIKSVFFPRATGLSENQENTLYVGSIKTVVGHTEGTAGIAGLLKASLALQNKTIPPNMHFSRLNPSILPFYNNLQVPVAPEAWPEGEVYRASVNSFGFGGTNAHCILERYDSSLHGGSSLCKSCQTDTVSECQDDFVLLPFSAYSEKSLSLLVDSYIAYLESNPSTDLGSFAHTLQRRSIFPSRDYVTGFSRDQILVQLQDLKAGAERPGKSLDSSNTSQSGGRGRILGVFTGQGAQWPTMGRDLISRSHVFSSTIDHLDDTLSQIPESPDWSLRQQLQADKHDSRCNEAAYSQPLCTAIQIALVDFLRSIDIQFSVVIGHSSGEIAAAYAAGCLTPEAAITIAYYRGLYSKRKEPEVEPALGMMAVGVSFSEARRICKRSGYSNRIFAAASNAPLSTTISGERSVLEKVLEELQERETFARMLHVDKAYHSPFMEVCAQPYLESLRQCEIEYTAAQPLCTWISSVHGFEMDSSSDKVDNNYWVQNLLQPVLFSNALEQAIRDHGPFDAGIEIGPHAALAGPTSQVFKNMKQPPIPYYGTLKRGENDIVAIGTCVGNLWTTLSSSAVSLSKFQTAINGSTHHNFRMLKDLPTYPWDHDAVYWKETRISKEYRGRQQPHELLGPCLEKSEHQVRWRNVLHPHEIPWLQDHKLQGDILFPAAGYCVMAVEAALSSWEQPYQLIELYDLDIRRGISLDEGSAGIEVISYLSRDTSGNANASDVEFSCCAGKIDGTDPLSIRFIARIRVQLGSPDVTLLPHKTHDYSELSAVDIDRFYKTSVGLEYTGVFRGLLGAERRMCQTSARVVGLQSSFPIHPASLDSCFQALFIAFAAPGDESVRTPFLPRRAKSMTLNPHLLQAFSGGDQLLYVDAYITHFCAPTQDSPSAFTGDIEIYNQDGSCLVQIEGFSCVALADYSTEHDRHLFHTTVWDQDISFDMVVSDYRFPNDRYLTSLAECERLAHDFFQINECITPTSETVVDGDLAGFEVSDSSTLDIKLIQAARNASLVSDEDRHQQFITARDRYLESSFGACRIRDHIARTVKQIAHKFARMKILELFAGNGATTELVLDSLQDAFTSYLLTDPSPETVRVAQAGLTSRGDKLQYMALDIVNLPPEQYEAHTYDLIIANTFPCSLDDACSSLENARQLLKPGGILLLAGVTGMSFFGCFVRDHVHDLALTDEEYGGSLVRSERDWDIVLEDCGFSGVDSIAYDTAEPSSHCHSLMISRAQGAPFETVYRPLEVASMAPLEDSILIIGGNSFLGARLIGELQWHLNPWSNNISHALSVDDILRGRIRVPAYVLNLEELDEPVFKDMTPTKFRALQNLFQQSKNVFWVTEGYKQADAYSAMTVGLGRVVATESPSLNLTFLDIDSPKALESSILAVLFAQFVQGAEACVEENQVLWAQEREMAIENGHLYIPRIVHAKDMNDRFNSRYRPITKGLSLGISSAQKLVQSHSLEDNNESPVAVKVIACSSMAFRIYDGTCVYLCIGMMEQEGHEAMTLAFTSSQGQLITANNQFMLDDTIDEDSAPTVLKLLTALLVATRLHESTKYGTSVIFTNDPVLANVLSLFLKERAPLMRLATSDKALAKIGGSTIYLHPHATLRNLRQILPADISLLINLEPNPTSLCERLFEAIPEACATIDSQCYFSRRATPSSNCLSKSSSTMAVLELLWSDYLSNDKALGEFVNTDSLETTTVCAVERFTDTRIEYQVERLDPKEFLRSDATYFLVGMTGELGESLCRWMVSNNVRHIAIASRSPKPARWHQELRSQGCQLMVLSLDVCNGPELQNAHDQIVKSMPPILGVVNGAMVLADAAFFKMTFEDFIRVLRPKVEGSARLDELFSDPVLDFFIMLSSTASLIGNAGQSNYSAANMYMKAIAEQRRQRGLVGSCVDIGMVLGLGVVSRKKTHEEHLRRAGLMAIAEPDFHCIFTEAIRVGQTTALESPCFSTGLHVPPGQVRPPWYRDPKFAHFQVVGDFDSATEKSNIKIPLQEKFDVFSDLALVESIIQEAFMEMLQGLLQLSAPIANPTRPLIELGIDSLLAIEIRSWLQTELKFQVSILKVLGGISLTNLCREAAEYAFARSVAVPKDTERILEEPLDREPDITSVYWNDKGVSDTLSYISKPRDTFTTQTASLTSYTVETTPLVTVYVQDTDPIALEHQMDSSLERTEPLSIEQEKMWFMLNSIDDPTMYNCTIQYEIHGHLDKERLESAVTTVARRHESLRTAFISEAPDGIPNQAILKDPRVLWTEINSTDPLEVPKEFINHQSRLFNLVEGETMAISVISQSEDYHVIIFSHHHLAMDGVSWQLVLREFAAAYMDPKSLPPVAAQYATFANEQRRAAQLVAQEDRKTHGGLCSNEVPSPLPLFPFTKSSFRLAQTTYEMTRKHYRLDVDTSNKIRQASSRIGTTAFQFHLAAIQLFLQQILQVDRFCIGIANANRDDSRFEKVVGLLVEILPLIFEPRKNQTFSSLAQETRSRVLDALSHSASAIQATISSHKDISDTEVHTPLYQVMVNYIAGVTHDVVFDNSVLQYLTSDDARQPQDLVITILEDVDGTTLLSFRAQDYLYDGADVQLLVSLYSRLIQTLSQNQERPLMDYNFLNSSELVSEQHLGNGSELDCPWSGGLLRRIYTMAEQYPDFVALKDQFGASLTYRAMILRVGSIMAILSEAGARPDDFIVVACGASVDAVCSLLGIWAMGAIYVPVDLDHGVERLAVIVDDCHPSAILCRDASSVRYLQHDNDLSIIELNDDLLASVSTNFYGANGGDTAVLLYTSGTTGKPKGVLLSHENLQCHIQAVEQEFEFGRPVVLQQSSHIFDASIFQMLTSLVHGGTLVMTNSRSDPLEIAYLILNEVITLTLAVPSEYSLWISEAGQILDKCSSWRHAVSGGEKMGYATTQAFAGLGLSDLTLINAYGPCEISIACTMGIIPYKQIQSDADSLHAGRPLPCYNLIILDERLRPVPAGWPGEICVGGSALAKGYLNREHETNKRFIDLDGLRLYRTGDYGRILSDGNLEYRGRISGDSQIKLRGMRIELDEISNAIMQSSKGTLTDAATIAKGDSDNQYLVTFIVFAHALRPADTDGFIKTLLGALPLPAYAKPAIINPIEHIPLTGRGKVDRKALDQLPLKHIFRQSTEVTGLGIIEVKLKELWEEYLPVTDTLITKQSNFFELGGNSLHLLKLQARIRQITNAKVPIASLFKASTFEEMAILIGMTTSAQRAKTSIDWDVETTIPEDLDRAESKGLSTEVKEVILTGATGSFGKALLRQLVEDPSIERIHCIAVRSSDDGSPRQLCVQSPKIHLYSGDLAHTTLGLSAKDISSLTATVDCIIHNGADVSFLKPYASLRAANVLSTKFLFGLCLPRRIPFHYISTAGIASLSRQSMFPERSLSDFPPASNAASALTAGYSASKWASEVFLEKASAKFGTAVHIHRPSSITSPEMPRTNVIGTVFALSREMKAVPATDHWEGYFDLISEQRAARQILDSVSRATTDEDAGVRFSHVCGETRFDVRELKAYMQSTEGGAFQKLPWKQWVDRARSFGLDPMVSAYLENFGNAGTRMLLPWLLHSSDGI
ncbi:polyketide synthase [Aspergillus steynii IBT 23096]|uniref:Polyketide synthase n=1 Tax=Aspergillus steynii IBT 23096 TaxID=1392250 RepID=A0A2I2G1D6_9EURO|nr:polyketide synthase [Aspergillus steynii IBT 23096]PLB46693.1 polyketide synthase [Aspergillus steynii IBT 23096]